MHPLETMRASCQGVDDVNTMIDDYGDLQSDWRVFGARFGRGLCTIRVTSRAESSENFAQAQTLHKPKPQTSTFSHPGRAGMVDLDWVNGSNLHLYCTVMYAYCVWGGSEAIVHNRLCTIGLVQSFRRSCVQFGPPHPPITLQIPVS